MKIFLLALIVVFCLQQKLFSQNIGINATGATPHASAMLDISDTSKGILIPRMTATQRTAIPSPAKGLMVFDNSNNNFWYYNGSAWLQLGGAIVSNSGWGLSGNTGTKADSSFIGTTDTQSLRIRVNNTWAGAIHPTSGNLFLGMGAGNAGTTGTANTAIGEHTLFANKDGNFNTANGHYALANNINGLFNAAFGSNALLSNISGGSNVAIGAGAMYGNTAGLYNTAVGSTALYYSKTANNNTAIGSETLYNDSTGNNNTAVGYHALTSNNGEENTAVGYNSLLANTTGMMNTAIGGRTLRGNTSGNYNTAVGLAALASNTTGGSNTAAGADAMDFNITGNNNSAYGTSALQYNTSGNYNIAIGFQAMQFGRTGSDNIAIGSNALNANLNGNKNIAIGFGSGTASYAANTFNTISIGNDDYLNGYQNQAFIGNTSTAWIGGKVTWSTFSDARIKNTIAEDVKGLDFILKLRPVTYHISNKAIIKLSGNKETPDFPGKYDNEKIKYSGFLAQEVEKAAKESHYDFSGYVAPKNQYQLYTLSYEQFVVPLVKAMQEQQKMIEELKNRLAALENSRVAK
ncbi:MAG: tail fiber domain-containing protein [Chitinophagaceae bacterium]